jgi:hypothetical protein
MDYDELSREVDWLRSRGFNPIPVPRGRKEVQGYSWKEFQTRPMSKEEFQKLSHNEICNVAVVCGQTSRNLYVADVDGSIPDSLKDLAGRTRTVQR